MTIPPKLKKWLPWIYVPVGYVVLFCMFAYGTFPYERLKQRIIVGYNNSQQGSPEPKRMEIGDVTWAWRFPGIVLSDVSLIGPKPVIKAGAEQAERSVIDIDEVYARVAPMSFLFGTTRVSFAIDGFGGTISGTFERSASQTHIEAEPRADFHLPQRQRAHHPSHGSHFPGNQILKLTRYDVILF